MCLAEWSSPRRALARAFSVMLCAVKRPLQRPVDQAISPDIGTHEHPQTGASGQVTAHRVNWVARSGTATYRLRCPRAQNWRFCGPPPEPGDELVPPRTRSAGPAGGRPSALRQAGKDGTWLVLPATFPRTPPWLFLTPTTR
jgi:hypothetical protein